MDTEYVNSGVGSTDSLGEVEGDVDGDVDGDAVAVDVGRGVVEGRGVPEGLGVEVGGAGVAVVLSVTVAVALADTVAVGVETPPDMLTVGVGPANGTDSWGSDSTGTGVGIMVICEI